MKNATKALKTISLFCLFLLFFACSQSNLNQDTTAPDYADSSNWAYYDETDLQGIDVFFVAPTVYMGDSIELNMNLEDGNIKSAFLGAINMEKGIYESAQNFYAPYYRQAGLFCFQSRGFNDRSDNPTVEDAFNKAYSDVEEAFIYYLSKSDRAFILAGFSQGSEMLIRLLKNKMQDESLRERHIATYAIGWRLTPSDTLNYSTIDNAKAETDLGVVVSFNSESEDIQKSLIVPDKTLSINPLSWTTDTVYAPPVLNLGACFTNYEGGIDREVEHLTGAYISGTRGTLKVPDVDPKDYPVVLGIFQEGIYHLYDYMFFYRNLQENVEKRIHAYKSKELL